MSEKPQYGLAESSEKRSYIWLYPVFLCILIVTAFSVATQQVAEAYGFHEALGRTLFQNWYAPWAIISWSKQFPETAQVIEDATLTGQLVFIVPQFVVVGLWQLFMRAPNLYKSLHGSARWAKKKDISTAGLFADKGVYVGGWEEKKREKSTLHYLRHSGAEHVLVFAPTRSGKGVGLVLPTLLSWPDSALILDIKGENWALTAGWRQQQGHRVLRFEPTDKTYSGARFNPLQEIRLHTAHAIADTQNIASMIVDPDGKGLKDYWNKAAFALLSGAILHCLVTVLQKEKRIANLSDLGLMLADPEKENTVLFNEMLTGQQAIVLEQALGASKEEALNVQQFIASSAREILNKAENEMSGVVSTSVANLALYRDPIVAKNTSFCDFRIENLMNYESPVSLYLVIRPSDIDRLRPLIRLILNIILRRLTEDMEFKDGRSVENYKYQLLLMMDEFTSLGRLEIFERSLAFMGGFGLKGYFIVQDLTQLYSAYTKDESIMSNCHIRIAYAPNKIDTGKVLSEMTGKATVVTQKTSLSGSRSGHLGRASVSISETGRALLTPDECMRLPGAKKDADKQITEAGDMLVFPAGFPPIYGKQILYFLDPVFLERAKVPTPLKSDRLVPDDTEETPTENPFIYTVEPDEAKQATDTSEVPEYSIDDEPDFEEPTFDGEEPDFDEPDFEEPDFDEQESA